MFELSLLIGAGLFFWAGCEAVANYRELCRYEREGKALRDVAAKVAASAEDRAAEREWSGGRAWR